jgi:kinesin family protein 3/17
MLRESSKKGFYVEGLSEKIINDEKDFQFLIDKGKNNRITKSTLLNEESSRSHSVLTIEV